MPAVWSCPGSPVLQQLINGQLSAAEAEAVERHVEGCRACAETLEQLVADHTPGGRPPSEAALRLVGRCRGSKSDTANAAADSTSDSRPQLDPQAAAGGADFEVGPADGDVP